MNAAGDFKWAVFPGLFARQDIVWVDQRIELSRFTVSTVPGANILGLGSVLNLVSIDRNNKTTVFLHISISCFI